MLEVENIEALEPEHETGPPNILQMLMPQALKAPTQQFLDEEDITAMNCNPRPMLTAGQKVRSTQ